LSVNKKFKSSFFSFIFSNPDVLRELYCALEGITLSRDVPVIINTLEDILFMDMNNDISFEIGGFKESLSIRNDDHPSQMYLKRCEQFAVKPPDEKWDGVYNLTSKQVSLT
jgi:hypothetical protein